MTDPIKIDADKVVTFHYKMRDAEGAYSESSEGLAPVVYLHGRGQIVPGLEKELTGKTKGDQLSVTVPPEEAYGMRVDNAVQRVPIKHLTHRGRLVPGQMVGVQTEQGVRPAQVIKVGHFNVDVDWNHPLAGRTLLFDVEIVDVREATPEELDHGHAHGPGGAHDH